MEVIFEDKDLEELIITGKNRKYKNIARDKKNRITKKKTIRQEQQSLKE